jgi:hypothetical protein
MSKHSIQNDPEIQKWMENERIRYHNQSNVRILTDLLEYLKEQHSNLPTHVFEVLGEVIDDLNNRKL